MPSPSSLVITVVHWVSQSFSLSTIVFGMFSVSATWRACSEKAVVLDASHQPSCDWLKMRRTAMREGAA